MVMQTWPASIPQYPENNYTVKPISGVSAEDDELSQTRTGTYQWFQGTFTFKQVSMDQLQVIRNFYDVTLNHSKPFLVPWLSLCGFNFHCCKFVNSPSFVMSGSKMDMSVAVYIIPLVPVNNEGDIVYGENI